MSRCHRCSAPGQFVLLTEAATLSLATLFIIVGQKPLRHRPRPPRPAPAPGHFKSVTLQQILLLCLKFGLWHPALLQQQHPSRVLVAPFEVTALDKVCVRWTKKGIIKGQEHRTVNRKEKPTRTGACQLRSTSQPPSQSQSQSARALQLGQKNFRSELCPGNWQLHSSGRISGPSEANETIL